MNKMNNNESLMELTYKYYVYNLVKSKFKGYKLVLELAKFGRYKNLKYDY